MLLPKHDDDRRCQECSLGYPKKCSCGGLIHAQFVKKDWRDELHYIIRCAKCDKNFSTHKE